MSDNLMAKKDYNITEITRLLLKMRDNCVQKEGEMYNDPERQEKYEALQAAIDLINNPSCLTGRWVYLGGDEWCCSNCGEVIHTEDYWPTKKYCHECGVKMY